MGTRISAYSRNESPPLEDRDESFTNPMASSKEQILVLLSAMGIKRVGNGSPVKNMTTDIAIGIFTLLERLEILYIFDIRKSPNGRIIHVRIATPMGIRYSHSMDVGSIFSSICPPYLNTSIMTMYDSGMNAPIVIIRSTRGFAAVSINGRTYKTIECWSDSNNMAITSAYLWDIDPTRSRLVLLSKAPGNPGQLVPNEPWEKVIWSIGDTWECVMLWYAKSAPNRTTIKWRTPTNTIIQTTIDGMCLRQNVMTSASGDVFIIDDEIQPHPVTKQPLFLIRIVPAWTCNVVLKAFIDIKTIADHTFITTIHDQKIGVSNTVAVLIVDCSCIGWKICILSFNVDHLDIDVIEGDQSEYRTIHKVLSRDGMMMCYTTASMTIYTRDYTMNHPIIPDSLPTIIYHTKRVATYSLTTPSDNDSDPQQSPTKRFVVPVRKIPITF